ncbi:phosphodiesterase [Pusillimonas sp.]|uniref:phosphodiesterase n=1 Tax=Pusillimonas sp. TaxID=3040095 RepID=UPI0037C75382
MTQPAWLRKAADRAAHGSPFPEKPEPLEEVVPGRVALVDGDYLAYFASGGDNMRLDVARNVAVSRMETVKELSGAEAVHMHLTSSGSTKGDRYLCAVTQPYQGQRKGASKPKNWEAVREFLDTAPESRLGVKRIVWLDREADDGIALAAYTSLDPVTQVVIHTADKDMRMLPGLHISWTDYFRTEVPKGTYEVIGDDGLVYGHKWFWMQMIMGDTADHIPGLPRWGEGKALKTLAGTTCNEEAYEAVKGAYEKVKGDAWADYFCEQASLLWLRQSFEVHDFIRVLPKSAVRELSVSIQRLVARVRSERAALDRLNAESGTA